MFATNTSTMTIIPNMSCVTPAISPSATMFAPPPIQLPLSAVIPCQASSGSAGIHPSGSASRSACSGRSLSNCDADRSGVNRQGFGRVRRQRSGSVSGAAISVGDAARVQPASPPRPSSRAPWRN